MASYKFKTEKTYVYTGTKANGLAARFEVGPKTSSTGGGVTQICVEEGGDWFTVRDGELETFIAMLTQRLADVKAESLLEHRFAPSDLGPGSLSIP